MSAAWNPFDFSDNVMNITDMHFAVLMHFIDVPVKKSNAGIAKRANAIAKVKYKRTMKEAASAV